MQQSSEHQFVIDVLTTLRQRRFQLGAWGNFLQQSWSRSCQTAHANPQLTHSWQRVTCLVGGLALGMLLGNELLLGTGDTLRLLPGFLLCVVWQQNDLFWHLGLNQSTRDGKLLQRLGIATTLTWLRGLVASYLLGRLIGGLPTPSPLALGLFLIGVATDILDGQIARWTATQSRLGQIADAEADFCLSLALICILLHNGFLPLWVATIMLLRFLFPLGAVLLSYFAFARPARFGSTWWGKCAGLAQCLYFLTLLAPSFLLPLTRVLSEPLLLVTLVLLVLAPLAQIVVNLRTRHPPLEMNP